MKIKYYLNDLGMINALGKTQSAILENLLAGSREGLVVRNYLQEDFYVAHVAGDGLPEVEDRYKNRLNRILAAACDQIRPSVEAIKTKYGAARIGVVLGSTDNGSEESLNALQTYKQSGLFPADYSFFRQEAHHSSRFVADYLGTGGIAVNISTACTSSARAIVYATYLMDTGVCDAVVAGGGDIVSESVQLGFHSLEAVDQKPCIPFSRNRRGINLGEGAALFVMCAEPTGNNRICLRGAGESSDAYHMTAPHPEGTGAEAAMLKALESAGCVAQDIDYINLHGTGTDLNDRMEANTTARVFPSLPPCSSTKQMVGHTLGAAGAMELGFCWLLLSDMNTGRRLPPHLWDKQPEDGVSLLAFVDREYQANRLKNCMSNSYAFGGCNVSLVISREDNKEESV